MSDKPLFQNADEQEAAYAPQQSPDEAVQDAVQADEVGSGDATGGDGGANLPLPGPGAAGAGAGQFGTHNASGVPFVGSTNDDDARTTD